jgi:UDP-N-acetylmuramate dehydrogenase
MGVGGSARWYAEARDDAAVLAALDWSERRGVPLRILGGGSNLVVADAGVDGLVLHVAIRGVTVQEAGSSVELTAAAGEPWDDVVGLAVERGWAGLECLSGIPGLVGATPIQNVGAYGQEVSDTIAAVRVLDRAERTIEALAPAACGFGYRDSAFKSRTPDRYVVLAVTYRLRPGGSPSVRYAELERHLAGRGIGTPTLADVRASVLAVRRAKSMVLDDGDPNRRSCGSFFVNPVVPAAEAERIAAVAGDPGMPRWPEPGGTRMKLDAAWLVERAGFARGLTDGAAGISTRHPWRSSPERARARRTSCGSRGACATVSTRASGCGSRPSPCSGGSCAWRAGFRRRDPPPAVCGMPGGPVSYPPCRDSGSASPMICSAATRCAPALRRTPRWSTSLRRRCSRWKLRSVVWDTSRSASAIRTPCFGRPVETSCRASTPSSRSPRDTAREIARRGSRPSARWRGSPPSGPTR